MSERVRIEPGRPGQWRLTVGASSDDARESTQQLVLPVGIADELRRWLMALKEGQMIHAFDVEDVDRVRVRIEGVFDGEWVTLVRHSPHGHEQPTGIDRITVADAREIARLVAQRQRQAFAAMHDPAPDLASAISARARRPV